MNSSLVAWRSATGRLAALAGAVEPQLGVPQIGAGAEAQEGLDTTRGARCADQATAEGMST